MSGILKILNLISTNEFNHSHVQVSDGEIYSGAELTSSTFQWDLISTTLNIIYNIIIFNIHNFEYCSLYGVSTIDFSLSHRDN